MNIYSWETSGSNHHRKKVKKTGTVVLHADTRVDTAFDRLQKEVTVERLHSSQKEAEDALANPHANTVKTALMTASTAKVLEQKMGFTSLLPCQAQCYRGIFNGRDVILHSRTGSGKTLAYALPIIERHLLLEQNQKTEAAAGPFLLIFVFSNDLAMQTRSVLQKIYGKQTTLRIAVAGFDDLQPLASAAAGAGEKERTLKKKGKAACRNGGAVDILIGTVRTLDEAIRGHKVAAAATAAEEAEAAQEARLLGTKRPRTAGDDTRSKNNSTQSKKRRPSNGALHQGGEDDAELEEDEAEAAAVNASDDDEGEASDAKLSHGNHGEAGVISPARVRAIVVDEVDTTLGPRFSSLGRRMKNLLKFIRKANGALSEGLLNDFRAHHYVLCGATIPNWVLKAGFLGVKKYYYQLVAVGTAKLPPQLECFHQFCRLQDRVAMATRLLTTHADFNGRVVVFGTTKQLVALEAALQTAAAAAAPSPSIEDSKEGNSKSKSKKKQASPVTSAAAALVVRSLTAEKDEVERVAAIEDFNSGVARVLLCTDVAARGLDFADVDTVLMLNLTRNALASDTFVHRAGRTARVGKPGRCVLLHDATEDALLDAIAKSTHVVLKALPADIAASLVSSIASACSASASSTAERQKEPVVALKLVVRSPFCYTKPQVKVPTAMQVLVQNVEEALRAHLTDVHEEDGSNGEVVHFTVPASQLHEVKQKLWKYTLQEA
ncbi:RNA helicase [Lotmaria passim]